VASSLCVAVCCSVLQCVAVCCNDYTSDRVVWWSNEWRTCCVLLCVAVCCSVLQCVAMTTQVIELFGGQISSELAVCGIVLQYVAECCSVLQCVAVCFCVLKCAVSYNDYTRDRVVWWSNE